MFSFIIKPFRIFTVMVFSTILETNRAFEIKYFILQDRELVREYVYFVGDLLIFDFLLFDLQVFVDKKPKAPVFKKRLPATSNVVEGESITFNLTIEGHPKPEVQWQFQGKDVSQDNIKIEEPEDDGKYVVTIQDCKMSDKGSFKCIATNKSGSINCGTSLTVKIGPPKVQVLSEEVAHVELNENALFEIELPSDGAKYKVDWMKGTKPIFRSTKKYEIGSEDLVRSFTVVDAQETDKGVYKCNISGPGGKTTKEFKLEIKGITIVLYFVFCCFFGSRCLFFTWL